jgi:hypothetical protein
LPSPDQTEFTIEHLHELLRIILTTEITFVVGLHSFAIEIDTGIEKIIRNLGDEARLQQIAGKTDQAVTTTVIDIRGQIVPITIIDFADIGIDSQGIDEAVIHLLRSRNEAIGHIQTRAVDQIDERILETDPIQIMDEENDLHPFRAGIGDDLGVAGKLDGERKIHEEEVIGIAFGIDGIDDLLHIIPKHIGVGCKILDLVVV